jgi:hypothetical protein
MRKSIVVQVLDPPHHPESSYVELPLLPLKRGRRGAFKAEGILSNEKALASSYGDWLYN